MINQPQSQKNKIFLKPLDEDPCPDCDVRFAADQNNCYIPKIAPASILIPSRWRKRKYLVSKNVCQHKKVLKGQGTQL